MTKYVLLSAAAFALATPCVMGQAQSQQAPLVALSRPSRNVWAAPAATRSARGIAVYRAASPSVVLIVTEEAIGSGSLVDASGLILTNWHVV